MLVGAVGDDDQRPSTGFGAVLEEREEEPVVQRRAAHRDEVVESVGQQLAVPRERLGQTDRVVEVDQEGPVARRDRGLEEAPRDELQAAPDGQHAVRRVDRETEDQGHVVGGVKRHRGPLPAVVADLEVLWREPAHRVPFAVRNENLELDQLDVDLALILGPLDEFGVFSFAAVGQLRHDADEVVRPGVLDRRLDESRAGGAVRGLFVKVAYRFHERLAAVELDPFEVRRVRQRHGCRHADRGAHVRLQPADLPDADRERPVDPVEHELVPAQVLVVFGVGQDLERLTARWVGQADASPERALPGPPGAPAIQAELDSDGPRVDDQGLDLDPSGEQLAVPALGRHDPDGRGGGRQVVSVRCRSGPLVDRVDLKRGQAAGFHVGPPHEPLAVPKEGLHLPTVRGDHLDREPFAGLEDARRETAAEAVLLAVDWEHQRAAAAVEDDESVLDSPDHDGGVLVGDALCDHAHRRGLFRRQTEAPGLLDRMFAEPVVPDPWTEEFGEGLILADGGTAGSGFTGNLARAGRREGQRQKRQRRRADAVRAPPWAPVVCVPGHVDVRKSNRADVPAPLPSRRAAPHSGA